MAGSAGYGMLYLVGPDCSLDIRYLWFKEESRFSYSLGQYNLLSFSLFPSIINYDLWVNTVFMGTSEGCSIRVQWFLLLMTRLNIAVYIESFQLILNLCQSFLGPTIKRLNYKIYYSLLFFISQLIIKLHKFIYSELLIIGSVILIITLSRLYLINACYFIHE